MVLGVLSLSGRLTSSPVPQGVLTSEPADGLTALVEHALKLHTGEVTADRLLERLQVVLRMGTPGANLPPHEQLVTVDRSGRIVAVANGTSSSVPLDGELLERLTRADERCVVVHNHPAGQGLAHDDLGVLTKPGVAGVIAVGNDGSLYAASLGSHYLALRANATPETVAGFVLRGHPTVMMFVARARQEIDRLLRRPTGIDAAVLRSHYDHLVGLALGHAGTIQYRAMLADSRRASFARHRDDFSRLTEQAGREVKRAMTRQHR